MTDRTDDFNRADGGLGANWTVMSDASNTGTLNIVSNQVKINTNGLDAASRWSADTFSGDHYGQCVATTIGTNSGLGPTVRNQLATTAKYEADSNNTSSTLYYFDGTNWTSLTAVLTGIANGDTLRFEVVGTGLTYRRNGTSILTATDATLSGGAPGLHLFEATSETIVADDWLGGPITATGSPNQQNDWPLPVSAVPTNIHRGYTAGMPQPIMQGLAVTLLGQACL